MTSKPEQSECLMLQSAVPVNVSSGLAEMNKIYVSVEVACALLSIFGNLLVIIAFARFRMLRTVTNYYVISLATADLLVGLLGIPAAIANSIGLPRNFYACLLFNSLLLFLCTGSIFSLLAVSVDRFWSIMWPLTYPLHMTQKNALCIIIISWVLAATVGLMPLMGWNRGVPPEPRCLFLEVMDLSYLVFVYFATIITPTLVMAALYSVIYMIVRKQVKRLSEQTRNKNKHGIQRHASNAHLISDSKAARNLAVIVVLFVVSWLPLYTINAVLFFHPDLKMPGPLMLSVIALSHFNSAWNPALYAWGLRNFRSGLMRLTGLSRPHSNGESTIRRYIGRHNCERNSIVSLPLRYRDISPTRPSRLASIVSCREPSIICTPRIERQQPLKTELAADCVKTIFATTGL